MAGLWRHAVYLTAKPDATQIKYMRGLAAGFSKRQSIIGRLPRNPRFRAFGAFCRNVRVFSARAMESCAWRYLLIE
jgi:hypothetical protein